jgi:thiosulfate reductase cytochrome b subunit
MKNFKKLINWSLLVVIILYIITGLHMTEYQTMSKLTFGLLSKALSFKIHTVLIYPLVILTVLHIYPSLKRKRK